MGPGNAGGRCRVERQERDAAALVLGLAASGLDAGRRVCVGVVDVEPAYSEAATTEGKQGGHILVRVDHGATGTRWGTSQMEERRGREERRPGVPVLVSGARGTHGREEARTRLLVAGTDEDTADCAGSRSVLFIG